MELSNPVTSSDIFAVRLPKQSNIHPTGVSGAQIPILWIAHIVFGLFLVTVGSGLKSQFSTYHAMLIIWGGLWLVVTDQSWYRTLPFVGYVSGSEVLWRMNQAGIFWESSKLVTLAALILILFRQKQISIPVLPTLFLIALLPGSIAPITVLGLSSSREILSFTMTGLIVIGVGSWFFSNRTITRHQFVRFLGYTIAPIITIATIVAYSIITNDSINWIDDSNFQTSGGFGPNQVSTILGYGALCAVMMLLSIERTATEKVIIASVALWLFLQAVLTFSRGGALATVLAVTAVLIILISSSPGNLRNLLPLVLIIGILLAVGLNYLEDFSGGALSTRFEDTDSSGRELLLTTQLSAFFDNPVTGVGAGLSPRYFAQKGVHAATHTEYTRLLSEHGLLGILAIMFIGVSIINQIWNHTSLDLTRAVKIGFAVWAAATLFHSATRILAPSIAFAIVFAIFDFNEENEDTNQYLQPRRTQ